MNDHIEVELKGIQQALHSNHVVPAATLSARTVEVGDDPAQLRWIVDAMKAHLFRVQEEREQATKALKKEKNESIEQHRVVQQEKYDL
jgi:hypothetical protein